jgi:D-tyrosyl-tRNA(Tyr) deacylase
LYESFVGHLRSLITEGSVATGKFRAMMDVHLVNNGPVTIILESKDSSKR